MFVAVALLLTAMLTSSAFAQLDQGQISGTVTDPQGAVVPGAKVTATNVGTGQSRIATADQGGRYNITNLVPGDYDVQAEGTGFQPVKSRVRVTVGGRLTSDIRFGKVAAAEGTTIDVIGEAGVAVNTSNQELSQVVNSQQITEVPTLTRNPYNLVGLAGNVAEDPSRTLRGAGFSINGQRVASTDILLDGGENVDLFGAAVGQDVPLDSVQEFRVITNNFSAEYGRAAGGVVNVGTKSGTNAFHGTLYEFNRVSALAANTFDNAISDTPKSRFTRNQFGYGIGGPIVKNKLFFFSSTEWIRIRSAGNTRALVAAPEFIAAANANTQGFYNSFGTLGSTTNPTGVVYSQSQLASGAVPFFGSSTPGPLFSALGPNTPIFREVNYVVPTNAGGGDPSNQYLMNHRVDFNFTDRTNVYVRYARQNQDFFPGTNADSPYAGYNTGISNINDNGLISLTHVFTPTLVSSSKIVYNRLNNFQPLGDNPAGPTLYMRGTTSVSINGARFAGPGYLPFSPGSAIPFGGPQNLYQFYEDLSWTKGSHQMKFGGNYIHARDNRTFGAFQEAVENLSTSNNSAAMENFLAGRLAQFQAAVDPQGKFPCATDAAGAVIQTPGCTVTTPVTQPKFNRNNRYNDFALYAQDSWKVVPRLTLNLGVRYEYYGVQHNADPSLDSNFYYGTGSNVWQQIRNGSVQIANSSPVGSLWEPDWNNFAPRFGFAWDVLGNGKTSLRGGYGISYERNFGNVTFNVIQNPPAYAVIALTPADVPGGVIPVTTDNAGPLAGSGSSKALPKTSTRWVDQNVGTAYANFWSAALEQEVARNTVVALEYSGSHGVHLYSLEDPNRPGYGVLFLGDDPAVQPLRRLNDQYTAGNRRGSQGESVYHGLNLRFQTSNLLNTGLQLTSNYTWSHAIDNLSTTFSESSNNFNLGLLDPYNPGLDRGNADFDVRHRWTTSAIWEMPWLKNHSNGWIRNIFGGYTIAPSFVARTGYPFTIFDCSNAGFTCPRMFSTATPSGSGHTTDTPDTPGVNSFPYITVNPLDSTSDPNLSNPLLGISDYGSACTTPGSGATLGFCAFDPSMVGRNTFRQPGFWNVDLGVYKSFKITERVGLQLRGEFFNLFNHHNQYVQLNTTDVANGASYSTSKGCTNGGNCSSAFDERRNTQLAVKIIF
jgi:outer membrane receptor protein involved in Fe transport